MTRTTSTLDRAHARARAGFVTALAVLAGCSSSPADPPDPAMLEQVAEAICDGFGPAGSFPLNGDVYDIADDCS